MYSFLDKPKYTSMEKQVPKYVFVYVHVNECKQGKLHFVCNVSSCFTVSCWIRTLTVKNNCFNILCTFIFPKLFHTC